MMITDKKLREAFLTDVEPYAETEKLLMEALDSTVPEKESKKVNTSIATDRKVSGREGERIVVGFLAMAAIAVIAVVLFKLIPSLRSPVSTDPGPDESVPPMETLVTGETEDSDDLEKETEGSGVRPGEIEDTARFCLVRSSDDGITITEADGTVLGTFPGMRAVYKKKPYGNAVYLWQQMQDYGTDGGNACILDDVMLWEKSEPLALLLPDEISTSSRLSGDAGFFDIEKGAWLMEPEHVDHFRLIGDCLWTEQADVFAQYETLRRFDGSIISGRTQPTIFYEHAGFITDTYQAVYDFSGNVLLEERDGSAGEEFLDILEGEGYIVRAGDPEDQTLIYSFDRELLGRETSGLVYRGHCGSYLNWIAGGKYGEILPGVESLVTTMELEQGTVLTESEFLEKNPQYAEGMDEPVTADTIRRDYLYISVCGVTADTFVILLEDMDFCRYICCDKDFYELSPSRTITLDPDYTEIRYREHGFEIHSFFDPEVSDGRDTLFPFNDYRNAFAYIPIREATETEKKEMNDMNGLMESFWLGDTEYRVSDKFFWSEADGACVFIEEDGKDQIYAILDNISGIWNTEITTR